MTDQKRTKVKFITWTDEQREHSLDKNPWHVVVGGVQCGLNEKNIGKQMPDFLRYAYYAGVEDERRRMAALMGLWKVEPLYD